MRAPWLLCLVCLGCHSMPPVRDTGLGPAASPVLEEVSKALEAGDGETACERLRGYVEEHPEARNAKALYAEILYRLGRYGEARVAFELATAALQEEPGVDRLFHCHGRLLDVAAAEADEYATHLHRGIGLYLLAQRRRAEPDADGDVSVEAILCKAALELTQAHSTLAEESRAAWYLSRIWRDLGQTHTAERWLRVAEEHAPFSYLTACERAGLDLQLSRSSTAPGLVR